MKRFEYALRPKRAGVAIPPLAVTVFNPDSEKFSEIATKPIALAVSAASRLGAGDLVGSLPGSGTQEIKSRAQGIFQNITDPIGAEGSSASTSSRSPEVTAGLWCGVGCLIAVVSAHRRKSGDVVWQRKRHARRTAERKLAEARQAARRGTIDGRTSGHSIGPGRADRRHAQHRRRGPDGVGSRRDARPDVGSRRSSGRRYCDCWKRSNRRNTGRESHPRLRR